MQTTAPIGDPAPSCQVVESYVNTLDIPFLTGGNRCVASLGTPADGSVAAALALCEEENAASDSAQAFLAAQPEGAVISNNVVFSGGSLALCCLTAYDACPASYTPYNSGVYIEFCGCDALTQS